jgi:hypothetical protein
MINTKSVKQMLSTIRAARKEDLLYYERSMSDTDEFPFDGAGATPLAVAMWHLIKGHILMPELEEEPIMSERKYDPKAIRVAMAGMNLTPKTLSERANTSTDVVYRILNGEYHCKGKDLSLDRVLDVLHLSSQLQAIDQEAATDTILWYKYGLQR